MANYEITGPDGSKYQVTAPDSASQADVLSYVQSQHLGAAKPPNPLMDAARSLPGGLSQGLASMAGIPGDLMDLNSQAAQGVANYLGYPKVAQGINDVAGAAEKYIAPTTASINKSVQDVAGQYYKPQTGLGQFAQTAASFAPAALGGEGSLPLRLLRNVALPAAGSEAGGYLTQGTPLEPYARAAGAVAGAVPSALSDTAATLSANPVSPTVASLVQKAENLGVPIRPGQYTNVPIAKVADDVLTRAPMTGFSDTSPLRVTPEAQRSAFNRALSNTFGENAPSLTTDVIGDAYKRLGNIYDTVLPRNTVALDPQLQQTLDNIKQQGDILDNALNKNDKGRVSGTVDYLNGLLNRGSIPGKLYQAMRQRGGMLDGLSDDGNPSIATLGSQIRTALDDAFVRQAQGNDGQLLQQANQQYRNLKVVDPLAAKAPTGDISPALLLSRVMAEYPDMASGGGGNIADLARIGQAFLKAPPNSGTPERALVLKMMTDPVAAGKQLVAMPFSSTIGRAMNRAINSPDARARLLAPPQAAQPNNLLPRFNAMPLLLARPQAQSGQ